MRPRKRHLSLLAAAALAVLIAALASTAAAAPASPAAGKPLRIVFFNSLLANTWSKAYFKGVKEAAKADGNVQVTSFDANFNAQAQFNQIQDALSQKGKFDGFVIQPIYGPGLLPVVKQAIAAGIKVACTGGPLGPRFDTVKPQVAGLTSCGFAPAYQDGQAKGRAVVEICKNVDPCKVAWLLGKAAYLYDQADLGGFQNVIKSHSNIKLVAKGEAAFLAAPAYTAMQDILQAHKDLNVIATAGDQMTLGAEKAVKGAGLAGKITLVGGGGSALGIEAVKQGRWWGTSVTLPESGGRLATVALIAALRGKPVAHPFIDEFTLNRVGAMVTRKNIKGFKPEWEG